MSCACLQIQGLKKSFGLRPVLRGIDLTLERGQRMALLGANGAGKTTLLRILAGLTQPGAGTVSVGELDLVRDAQRVRACVGFVAHQPYLYEELTALENLNFFGKMYAVKDIRERARTLLRKVGLEKKAAERVNVLSRGQVQRLALARALLHSPQLLLLDEPDTGLDQEGHELIETILTEHISKGGTALFTTHQLERALELGDSVTMLKGGRIAWQQQTVGVELDSIQRTYQSVTVP